MKNIFVFLVLTAFASSFLTCSDDNSLPTNYGQFELNPDNSISMDGNISADTPIDLKALLDDHPDVKDIKMKNCAGIELSPQTLEAARLVRSNNMNTHIESDGLISRGGLNFFLAGVKRSKDPLGRIGVGSWEDELGNEATDFDFGDSVHTPYLNYYVEMGIQFLLASDFYYFSIQAAGPDDLFILTDDLIDDYGLLKE